MSNKNAAPLVTQQEPQAGGELASTQPTPILPNLPPDVKALQVFIKRRHIPMMDLLEVVKTIYPMCDKSLLSRCANGHKNGVMLRPDALRALQVHFAEDGRKGPSEGRRKKPNRCVCRVTDAVFVALQRRIRQTGQTVQDYLEALILEDLQIHREELLS